MRAISASIIVLSGALLLAIGATIQHGQRQTFVTGVGVALGLAGLIAWAMLVKRNEP